jgi:holo-[acyl-carrier-protein] synthase
MIIGIGTDIVEHAQNAKLLTFDELGRFPDRILSENEASIYKQKPTIAFISGRFAAKEAVLKALGIGMYDSISLKNIEIKTTKHGKPTVALSGEIKIVAEDMNVKKWHLSISHSENFSIAIAIAESDYSGLD